MASTVILSKDGLTIYPATIPDAIIDPYTGNKYNFRSLITINNQSANEQGNFTLTYSSVGAAAASHSHSEYALTSHTHTGFAASIHTHDDRYSQLGHTHSDYALKTHDHDESYSPIDHVHSIYALTVHSHKKADITDFTHTHSEYSLTTHNHDNTYAAKSHTHTISQITDFGSYAPLSHTHVRSQITDFAHTHSEYSLTTHNHDTVYAAKSHTHDYAGSSHTHVEADITDFGSYAPLAHTHTKSQITDFSHSHSEYALTTHTHSNYSLSTHDHDTVYSKLTHDHDTVYSKLAHNHDTVYAAKSHSHTKSQITDFAHTHVKADITDFAHSHSEYSLTTHNHDSVYAEKDHTHNYASSLHTHVKSDITDFGSYAPLSHTHTKSQITDFSHTHTKSNITDFAHTHGISDIEGLSEDLIEEAPQDGYLHARCNGDWVRITGSIIRDLYQSYVATAPTASANTSQPTNQNVQVTAVFSSDNTTRQYSIDNSTWNTYTGPVTMTNNGTVYFRGLNSDGTPSPVTSYTVSNIDKASPAAPTTSASTTAQTTGKVIVTAVFSSDSVIKEYSLDNSTWSSYTSGIEFSENGTVYFRGKDAAGNVSNVVSYAVTNIVRQSAYYGVINNGQTYAVRQVTSSMLSNLTSIVLSSDVTETIPVVPGSLTCVFVPNGYVVYKNNGSGGKVPFDENNGTTGTGSNGSQVTLNSTTFKSYGEFNLITGNTTIYIQTEN